MLQVEAQKPEWRASSTAQINLGRNKGSSSGQGPSTNGHAQKFQLHLGDEDDDDQIDEDALLTAEDLQRPAPGP